MDSGLIKASAEFYIKASEAARRIGVSLVTAKRMIGDGRLVGEKMSLNSSSVRNHTMDIRSMKPY